jgi:hypothetical protein
LARAITWAPRAQHCISGLGHGRQIDGGSRGVRDRRQAFDHVELQAERGAAVAACPDCVTLWNELPVEHAVRMLEAYERGVPVGELAREDRDVVVGQGDILSGGAIGSSQGEGKPREHHS